MPNDTFLQKATHDYFKGRGYLKHSSYLFFVLPYNKALNATKFTYPFRKVEKGIHKQMDHTVQEFIASVNDAVSFVNNSRKVSLTQLKESEILELTNTYFNGFNEGVANNEGYTWGLTPAELAKNLAVVILVIFSTQVLGVFDAILVAIETQYRDTAPALLPLQMQDIDIEQDVGALEAAKKAMAILYEALVTPLYGLKMLAFIIGVFLWLLDLFIYPLFLAERFFLLGIMQAFFPLVISLAVFEKFRSLAYNFFKLYAGVYMLVPPSFWSMYS